MIYYRCFRQTFPSIADHVKSKSRRSMASWLVTGYDKCYHCMPDYFEFANYFLNQGHRALLGDGPYLVQVPYLELEKMRSMHSAQRKVEFRRLGNQLPVLGKDNSFCTIVKLCVFCDLFWAAIDIPDYRNCGKIRVPSRRCTEVPVAPPGGGENMLTRACYAFSSAVPLFRSLLLHLWVYGYFFGIRVTDVVRIGVTQ